MNHAVIERTAPATDRTHRRTVEKAPARLPGSRPAVASQVGRWPAMVLASLGVLAVLLAGTWSFAQGWGRGPVVGPGELAVGGGIARVDAVVSAARPMNAMPGMGTDKDPVADGYRRISVDVTLQAQAGDVQYAAERFGLVVNGEEAEQLTDRSVLPGNVLPAGTQLSGTLLFDIPSDATTATFSYGDEGSTQVLIPAESEQTTGPATQDAVTGEHGGSGHPQGAAPTGADSAGAAGEPGAD